MEAPRLNVSPIFNVKRPVLMTSLLLSVAFCLSACSQPLASKPENRATALAESPAQQTPGSVTIFGQFPPEEQEKFEQTILPFEEETGIDVVLEFENNFNSLLSMRIASFNKPDLAILPQPGLMADLAADGQLIPITEAVDIHALRAAYSDTWLDLGETNGEIYGLWNRVSVKSLVWYRPTAFEEKSYDIPRTWPELMALSDRIVADGGTPWCIGLESGAATGWPGTDWIEDILLRTAGPETYRQWISHQISFDSPPVLAAFESFGELINKPGYVDGGSEKVLKTGYAESVLGIFNNPPSCYLHRQGNFIANFFPEGKAPRIDYDVFLLPPIDEKFGTPLLIAGETIVMFNHTPESAALMQYLATPTPHKIWAGLGGFISPQKDVPLEAYPDAVTQTIAQILADADVVRFDGSDLMPGYVGSNLFWQGMVDFVGGRSAAEVTTEIDKGWP
ncbi:MAG: ABC transporter substrate-binding protein [Cyanobacteria bacterium J06623_5]